MTLDDWVSIAVLCWLALIGLEVMVLSYRGMSRRRRERAAMTANEQRQRVKRIKRKRRESAAVDGFGSDRDA